MPVCSCTPSVRSRRLIGQCWGKCRARMLAWQDRPSLSTYPVPLRACPSEHCTLASRAHKFLPHPDASALLPRPHAGSLRSDRNPAQAASDVYAPVSGEVVEVNNVLADQPATVRRGYNRGGAGRKGVEGRRGRGCVVGLHTLPYVPAGRGAHGSEVGTQMQRGVPGLESSNGGPGAQEGGCVL